MGVGFSSVEWKSANVVAGIVAFVLALLAAALWNKQPKKYRLPPGPPTYPVIGNMNVLMNATKPTHQIVDDLAKIYGPLLILKAGVQKLVFVSDSEMTAQFLTAQDHLFAYRPEGLTVAKYLLYGNGQISFAQQGDYHSFMRKFLVSELLSNKKLQGFRGMRMEEQTSTIREAYLAAQRQEPINIRELINSFTMNIITTMAFGKKFFGLDVTVDDEKLSYYQAWAKVIPEMTTCFEKMLAETIHPSLYWIDTFTGNRRAMQSCHKRLDALCQDLVDEHKHRLDALSREELQEYEPKDFMDSLLLLRGTEAGKYVTDLNLKAITLDLVVGGSETSATTLEWCMAELIKAPELMKRAQDEVDIVVGLDRTVNESDIPKMPFLAAVIKETFRLHPPVPWLIPHSNRVDCKVGGYDIPKGSFIQVNVYGMSRNAAYWPDPLRFDPDRFYDNAGSKVEVKGAHPQLLPFGAGRRICPGMNTGLSIVHSTLARMVHSFDWKYAAEDGATEVDLKERSGLVAAKLVALVVFGTPRLPAHLY